MAPTLAPSGCFHHLSADAALSQLDAPRSGLSNEEAAIRLLRWGANRLPEQHSKTLLSVIRAQFANPFIYLLLAAAGASLVSGHLADAVFIFAVLLLNAGIGSWQEWRAERRTRALRELVKGTVTVLREGRLQRLPAEALVPGDIVRLESGERVPADLRLLQTHALLVDESLLTGESMAVRKSADASPAAEALLSERSTMLHAGTIVQTGRAVALVVATGARTMVGQMALQLERPGPVPPLLRRMARFTRQIAAGTLVAIAVIAAFEFARGAVLGDIFVLAVALAVSAIPEGLPVAMTVALSIATHRMGLRNVVVRHLPAVEGLGACTVIATDKTGTLTLNALTVVRLWLPDHGEMAPTAPEGSITLMGAARASEHAPDEGGDAVDRAFVRAAIPHGWDPTEDGVVARIPYEPERRFAAVFRADSDRITAYVKGAPETILPRCAGECADAQAAAEALACRGYRVIAVAAGPVANADESCLRGLRLLALAALVDPLRPEAHAAVQAARHAGVRVVMLTGDHPLTALAIARELELAHEQAEVVTGVELAQLQGDAFDATVARVRVFARLEPLQKLAIVEGLRRRGEIVAVTGDGVNDAPALHAADIGVAMGKDGTDVARDAADLILTDDNFASIVAGIEEGRIAYANLRKVILLLLSTGGAEILLVLGATLSGLPPPLTAVQLLWLNLVTNGMQDVALAFEKGDDDVLRRSPRAAHAPLFDRSMIVEVMLGGAAIGLTAFAAYYAAMSAGAAHAAAQGMVLWLLVWCENAHALNCRSETRSILQVPWRNNPLLLATVIATQLLQISVLAMPPLRELLSLQALDVADGLRLSAVVIIVVGVMEAYKWRLRRAGMPDASAD